MPRTLVAGRRLGCGGATWFDGSDRFTTLVRLRWLLRGDSLTSCLVIFERVDYVRQQKRVCEVENDIGRFIWKAEKSLSVRDHSE